MVLRNLLQAVVLLAQVGDPTHQVLLGLERVLHSHLRRSRRHELQQAHGAGWALRVGISGAFDFNLRRHPDDPLIQPGPEQLEGFVDLAAPVGQGLCSTSLALFFA